MIKNCHLYSVDIQQTSFAYYLFKAMCLNTQLHMDLQVVFATVTFKTNINANPTWESQWTFIFFLE